jgi:excisionase family DNA binding protein
MKGSAPSGWATSRGATNITFASRGRGGVWAWYRWQVLLLVILALVNNTRRSGIMFRNNLVIAWRNITRSKVYSALNIFGLAVFGSKKKLKRNERPAAKIRGIEPLLSPKEAGEILGCSRSFVHRLMGSVPYYRIGRRVKFKLTNIVNYRDSKKIEP